MVTRFPLVPVGSGRWRAPGWAKQAWGATVGRQGCVRHLLAPTSAYRLSLRSPSSYQNVVAQVSICDLSWQHQILQLGRPYRFIQFLAQFIYSIFWVEDSNVFVHYFFQI